MRKRRHQCNHYHYPLPSVSNAYKHHHTRHIYNGYVITVISVFSIRNILLFVPGAEAAGPQAHEDGADELAEGGCVDRIQFLFLTVPQVMVIQGAARQAHSLRCLVVVQQPLQLKTHRGRHSRKNQWAPVNKLGSVIVTWPEMKSSASYYKINGQNTHHTHSHTSHDHLF